MNVQQRQGAPTIGFVILSHGDERLLKRLVDRLDQLYDAPPIAVHHDFSQAALDTSTFSGNVEIVERSITTGWGKFSVVSAGLAALQLLYRDRGPDWFVLLSAADYPVRPAAAVREELAGSQYDAFIDSQLIPGQQPGAASIDGPPNPKLGHFSLPSNRHLKWQFYLGARIWFPLLKKNPRWRIGRHTIQLPFAASGPFGSELSCYYGDHWFTANRRAAQALLTKDSRQAGLSQHLRLRAQADECYYQTILCNTPGLSICLDNKRYAEWNGGGAHPMAIAPEQVDTIVASGAHFARKFTLNSVAVTKIDRKVDSGRVS